MAKKGVTFNCVVCGVDFYRYPSQIVEGKGTTCSRTCAARHFRDKGEMVSCVQCEKPFYRQKWMAEKGFGNYCSKPCWGESRKTPFGTGPSGITPAQRKAWIGSECARCNATENLELDHILARSLGGQNTVENMQTLCKTCNLRKFQCEDLPAYLASTQ